MHKIALKNQKTLNLGNENFEKSEERLTEAHLEKIRGELNEHSVFKHLLETEREKVAEKFFLCTGKKDEFLFKQNDALAEHFFIILKGIFFKSFVELGFEILIFMVLKFEKKHIFF